MKGAVGDTYSVPGSLNRLGSIIRVERERRGLSQEALASLGGVSRTYLGEIERGSANPSFTTLEQIADALGLALSELIHVYERAKSEGASSESS